MKKSLCLLSLCGAIVSQNLYAEPIGSGVNFYGYKNFTIGASWLRWKAYEEGLSIGVISRPSTTSFTTSANEIRPSFDTSNGYRAYLSFQTDDERWLFKVTYSHLPVKGSKLLTDDPNGLNFITVTPETFPLLALVSAIRFTNANSHLNMNINYVDFDVSHNLVLENKCKIIPQLGLRVLWEDQNYKMQFNSTPDSIFVNSEVKSRVVSIGVKGGLVGEYSLGGGFSVLGEFGGSLLYGRFKNTGFATYSGAPIRSYDYVNRMNKGFPTVDTNIGLNYASCYQSRPYNVYASWENHYFFRLSQFANATGNITAQGLTLGANISL